MPRNDIQQPKLAPTRQYSMAVFGLLYGAITWGIVWYPYRLLNDVGIVGVAASFYTYGFALIFAGLFYCKHWRSIFQLPISIIGLCIAAGITNIAYILAVIDGEVVRVMLLFYLSPIWTLLLAHYWLKERTNKRGLVVIILALIGAFIMLFDTSSTAQAFWRYLPLPQNMAEWLALLAGVGFSVANVMTRQAKHLSLASKSFAVWSGVVVTALILIPVLGVSLPLVSSFDGYQWLLLCIVAFMLLSATVSVQYGVTKLPATRASVIFLFELVVAAIAAYYLADEVLAWNEWLGGAFIIIASYLSANNTHD